MTFIHLVAVVLIVCGLTLALAAEQPTWPPGEWEAACRELTAASAVPWVLLSGGISFKEFRQQTEIACRCGASGVVVGRGVPAASRHSSQTRPSASARKRSRTPVCRFVSSRHRPAPSS